MAFLMIAPIIANPQVQTLAGIVYISTETRSAAGVLTTAGTSTLIQISDPSGAIIQSFTAMTAGASAGLFSYSWATAITNFPGKYSVQIKTTDSGSVSIGRADFLFELVLSS